VTKLRNWFKPGILSQYCCSIHLFFVAKEKTALPNKQIKNYIPADFLIAEDQYDAHLDPWAGKSLELIRNVKLRVVLDEYLKSGTFLTLLRDEKMETKDRVPEEHLNSGIPTPLRAYRLKQLDTDNVPRRKDSPAPP
jgi:hypothetical protein